MPVDRAWISPGWPGRIRIPAQQLEDLVARIAQEALNNQSVIAETLNNAAVSPHLIPGALQATNDAAPQIVMESRREVMFAEWVQRVDLSADGITVTLSLASVIATIEGITPITMCHSVPLEIKRRGIEMRLVMAPHNLAPARIDLTLVKTIARAYCWFNDLTTGRVGSITEIAQREGVGKSYVGDIIKLAFLPPKLVEQIVTGKQHATMVTDHLIKSPLALEWKA